MSHIELNNPKVIVGEQYPSRGMRIPNSFFLKNNSWNDFNYLTTYQLYYFDSNKSLVEIGNIKIAKGSLKSKERPFANGVIDCITDDYFSLGQDKSFYIGLRDLPEGIGESFLIFMRDLSYNRSIWIKNKNIEVLEWSLFRDLTNMDVISFLGVFKGEDSKLNYCLSMLGDNPLKFNVDHRYPFKNSNIHAIIGNNGVGKTTFLKDIAKKIVENQFECKIIDNQDKHKIDDGIDIDYIEKVLFVSFSAFDNSNLDLGRRSKFEYLGLHDGSGGFKGPEKLSKEFEDSLESLLNSKKIEYIEKVLNPLKNVDYLDEHIEYFLENVSTPSKIIKMYKNLSSGHRIVLHTLIMLMDILHQGIVTLFDEPETHLHPPLLGAFLQSLQTICDDYNGLLVFATHSPIILQEVLSPNVVILRRIDGTLVFDEPNVITYGQNVSKLTRTAFGYQKVGFHKTIMELIDEDLISKKSLLENKLLGTEAKKVALAKISGDKDV
ncbi:AAA family ATPase [Vibrio harveyi]|uniref:AAA family ATPase n=1 Tax=Vibrio harveyi TaxID=669 RepID=UPI00165E9A22|nr:AAA family ATPase [Vibrio harveyi]EKO3782563.1 AAA family ATPase [Vibrio harveyi]